jgi:hypothetical protein
MQPRRKYIKIARSFRETEKKEPNIGRLQIEMPYKHCKGGEMYAKNTEETRLL